MTAPHRTVPVAIVGVSALFPGSTESHGFWRDILAGTDLVTDVPASHWLIEDYYDPDPAAQDKTYAKRGAFLKDVAFDPMEWGVPPSIVPATDTAQLLSLILAKQVLDDASRNQFDKMDKEKISIILGVTGSQELLGTMVNRLQKPVWVKALREIGLPEDEVQRACGKIADSYVPWQESSFPGLLGNVVAGRIANRLNLGGTNAVTDAACASSFSALSMGVNELALGQSDVVIIGGVDTMNDIFMYLCFSKTPALSKSGDCRPFSDKADGTLLGEGIAMFALKRLDDAERDNDRIYAVIKACGSSSDGRSKSVYAPVSEGQAKALRRAYESAGYSASTVELVEAHGTGTVAGDAAEFGGLKIAFDESGRADRQWCALGTVKSQIGHTKAAAGAAGLFKAVLALHHKVLPPTIKIDRPNPKLDIGKSPFYLNTETRPWIRGSDHPRRASVSSFGFGGSNFHVAVEEYTGTSARPDKVRTLPGELVVLSGANGAAVALAARTLTGECTEDRLRFLAHRSIAQFDPSKPARLAIVASSETELKTRLDQAANAIATNPEKAFDAPFLHYGFGEVAGKVGFLFPGQGSQYLGMGGDLAVAFDAARAAWDAAADIELDGVRLHHTVFPRPKFSEEERTADDAKLRDTRWAQPAIGVASLATLGVLQALGVEATAYAGHSFGEITALCAAGSFGPDDLVRIARRRGELMATASLRSGSMTAVPKSREELDQLVGKLPDDVVVANHNSPKQLVLSGPTDGIAQVEAALLARGVEAKRLPVATAFHSTLVSDATGPFGELLRGLELAAPTAPVYSNAEISAYGADRTQVAQRLADQLASPVRWVELIEQMYADGVRTFVEVGPGSVLSNLVGEILAGRAHRAIPTDRRGKSTALTFLDGVGRMAVAGVKLDLQALWAGYGQPVDPSAKKRSKAAIDLNGSNYGKPYPPAGGAASLPKPNGPRAAPKAEIREVVVEKVVERIVEKPVRVEVPVHVPVQVTAQGVAVNSGSTGVQMAGNGGGNAHYATPGAAAVVAAGPAWVQAYYDTQRATAEAHQAWQRAMSDTHLAFLQAVEASFAGMSGVQAPIQAQVWQASPQVQPAWQAPQIAAAPTAWQAPTPQPQVSVPVQQPAPVAAAVAPKPQAAAPAVDVQAALLSVVSEKTGYPLEMLGLEMELESDLGIDSIKRVEILSAIRERIPGLPEADGASMGQLRTLGQIADQLRATLPDQVSTYAALPAGAGVAAGPAKSAPVAAKAPSGPTGTEVESTMLAVVAEKTGYPYEMLALEMELEADLGIDSIKRVEILSGVRERIPSLPEVDAAALGQLRTLGQIVDHLRANLPAGDAAPAPARASSGPSGAEIESTMMAVVAEKTGYPPEMLALEMELESDLGIDSIKRVEILSAVRERVPSLPEVDAAALGALRTLGQIVDHLRGSLPAGASAPAPVAVAAAPSLSGAAIESTMLAVVAEKTGYPSEMLAMGMELESDLGIDSIKRVEILSAVRERVPELPEVDAAALGQLRTLGQIVDHLRASLGPVEAGKSAVTSAHAVPAPSGGGATGGQIESTMLEVVAEKTGYPAEMLGMTMELESDLGIDSIKRVEILSAVRERIPSLPEVDAAALGQLRTLGQIVEHLRSTVGAGSAESAPGAGSSELSREMPPGLGRWMLREVDAPAAGASLPGLKDGKVAVTAGGPLMDEVVNRLRAAGVDAVGVNDVPLDAAAVVFLGGLADGDADVAHQVHEAAFLAAKAVAARFGKSGGLFVTVQDTGGDFGLRGTDRCWFGGLPGLVKTAAQEWPNAACKAIDLERGGRDTPALADAIVAELIGGGGELEVGLHADGRRTTLISVADKPERGELEIGGQDVVVATGGARGVTASCLIALAKASKARFALLGRTPLADEPAGCAGIADEAGLKKAVLASTKATGEKLSPAQLGGKVSQILANREIHGTIAAIRAAGGDARYLAVDVNDPARLDGALDEIRALWGPVTAVVHGAGVLADKLLADKTLEQYHKVFDTKVNGLRSVLAATAKDPVRTFVMFSSVAGRCGNRGQSDYAMANEVLNKAAGWLHSRGIHAKSMDWGPWQGGMVNPALAAHFASMGVAMIPLDVGAKMFVDELRDTSSDVELVLGGEPRAESLAGETGGRSATLSVRLQRLTHPWLGDHTISGVPVVPVVLALEWMAQAARAARPDLVLDTVDDIKVLRGIKADKFDADGNWYTVTARETANGRGATLAVEVRGEKSALHYTATATLRHPGDRAPSAGSAPKLDLQPHTAPVYDGHLLFHGPELQVIRSIDGVSKDGIAATLSGTTWPGGWATDPAALDGGLQLALLWTRHRLGGASLPMGVASYRRHHTGPVSGPIHAALRGEAVGKDKAVSDIVFTDASGRVVAELRGVTTILRPGEPTHARV